MISWLKKLIVGNGGYQPIRKLDVTNPPAEKKGDKFRIIERVDGRFVVQRLLYLRVWVWSDTFSFDNLDDARKILDEIISGIRNRRGEKIISERFLGGP